MNIDRMEFIAWMERIMDRFDILNEHINDVQKHGIILMEKNC